MYLSMEETKKIEKLEAQIDSKTREIYRLEKQYNEVSYPAITSSGGVYRGGSAAAEILQEINRAKKEKARLEASLRAVRSDIAEDRRRINEESRDEEIKAKEREKRNKERKEKRELFESVKGRWKNRSFFYKLTHLNIRPNKVFESLGTMDKDEIQNLYRR